MAIKTHTQRERTIIPSVHRHCWFIVRNDIPPRNSNPNVLWKAYGRSSL